jgi:SAM-dependent methyltransferase
VNDAVRRRTVPDHHDTAAHLFRVLADDAEYRRQASAEAAFWNAVHPLSLEATEAEFAEGPIERYVNARFTGDPSTDWTTTIASWGTFRQGLLLGISSPRRETSVLETNPSLHVTLLDISAGAVERRSQVLGERFRGRVATATADLNFLELPPAHYDLIVSSSTNHHVTNLEHLAFQINRALTPDGYFFLEDYVGEPRFAFSDAKRRLFEVLYNRDVARQPGRKPGLVWRDASDLSPFCGVRSDEILDVFRTYLDEVQVRSAATLTTPMSRSQPVDLEELWAPVPRWKVTRAMLARTIGFRRRNLEANPEFIQELYVVGHVACEAGLLRPGVAFAVYRKRRS